jgi:PAT family beta-lactamase induction signal transducer AmpG
MNYRLLSVLLLGFSSGLPLALIGSTLQAWFTQAHTSLITIGFLSLLGIPYTLKFLWAPLMDHYSVMGLGRRKGWILLTQLGLVITLLLLAAQDPKQQALYMGYLAFFIAFFSASQDIAIDAYRADLLQIEEMGIGASYYIFAYRIAILVSGGLALICAELIGWKLTYDLMALLILLLMVPAYLAPNTLELTSSSSHFLDTLKLAVVDILQREKIVWVMLFIIFYKIGDALALSLMTTFLLQGLHFSLIEVGLAYKIVSVIATILGALIAGIFLTSWNIYRALLLFGLAQAFSNLMFVLLAMVGKDFLLMVISIFIENFCSGLSTAAILAFMMSLCHRRFTASQFALLSAFASLGRVLLGPVASLIVKHLGWMHFYFISFLLCFPALIFLMRLKNEVSTCHRGLKNIIL